MNVASIGFLLLVLVPSSFFFALPSARVRRLLLAALSAAFLATNVPNCATWGALAAFVLSGWLVARALARRPSRAVLIGYLVVLVAAFLLLKKYAFLAFLPTAWLAHPIGIVGLSYMLFRQIHFLVDVAQGQIARPRLWTYLNYQLNLFMILSGPIQRFQQFATDWQESAPIVRDPTGVLLTYGRLFWGLFLMTVVGDACLDLYEQAVKHQDWSHGARTLAILYAYPAYVFINFSGYSSLVIAAAALFGLRVPENFNRPYAARNMLDYWNRWHISLSHWIRDYIFTPTYKALATRWPRRGNAIGPICFFVAFLIAGIWHGSSTNFVIFGLLNGLGVSIAKTWENLLIWRLGRKGFRAYLERRGIAVASTLLNFHYACATILFLPPDLAGWRVIAGLPTT